LYKRRWGEGRYIKGKVGVLKNKESREGGRERKG
jgi:hypothetical protein